MNITENQLKILIRNILKENDEHQFPMVKSGSVFKDAIKSLQDAGFKKAELGRTKVGDGDQGYGRQQNKDVFASGPFRVDLRNYFKQEPKGFKLGNYYFNEVYGRSGIDKQIFDIYIGIVKEFKFKKSAYGLAYDKPMTLFEIDKIHQKIKNTQNSKTHHYKLNTDSLNKLLSVILKSVPQKFKKVEALWVKRVKNSDVSIGTHYNGGAFDLKGYNKKTPRQKLSQMKKIINKTAEKYGTSIAEFGAESDHIHVGLKI